MANDRMNEMDRQNGQGMDRSQMDRQNESRPVGGQQGRETYNVPAMRGTDMPMQYRDDYRDIYRGYRMDRMNKAEKNVFRNGNNYRQYNAPDEIYETIISHLTKGVMFHDRMMDMYGFMGLYGFKKMHEYQLYSEYMERRKAKCYVLEHMNLLIKDMPDEQGLNFIPEAWYSRSRHELTPEIKKQYIEPSFQGYKKWEEETKDLLSYCANELMYMGQMAEFKEVMEMVEDVEKELHKLEELLIKLESVDFDMKYVLEMQEKIYKEYEDKLEECFEKKIEHDRKEKRHLMSEEREGYGFMGQRRSAYTGRFIRG